eukprot:gene11729-24604_t
MIFYISFVILQLVSVHSFRSRNCRIAVKSYSQGSVQKSFPLHMTGADDNTPIVESSSIIFIGNLPFQTSDADLSDIIASRGVQMNDVLTTRIAVTKDGKPRGFGYVDFLNPSVAENAMAKLVGMEIDGRGLKIDYDSGRDGANKGRRLPPTSKDNSIFVGNLDFSLSEEDLSQLLTTIVGEVPHKVRFSYTPEGRFKGFAHVDMANEEDVETAIGFLNDKEVLGRRLRVERAGGAGVATPGQQFPQSSSGGGGGGGSNSDARQQRGDRHSLFLGNLAYDVTADTIAQMIDDVAGQGLVRAVRLSFDRDTGEMRGFGHADFNTADEALMVAEKLNGMDLFGRPLKVDLALSNSNGGRAPGRGGSGGGRGRWGGGGQSRREGSSDRFRGGGGGRESRR